MKLKPLELKQKGYDLIDTGEIASLASFYEGRGDCVFMLDNGRKAYEGISWWWNNRGTDCRFALNAKRSDGTYTERILPSDTHIYVFKPKAKKD